MDAKTFDKAKLPSRHVTEGPQRAPHRSYYYAMGLSSDQIHQPFVGTRPRRATFRSGARPRPSSRVCRQPRVRRVNSPPSP